MRTVTMMDGSLGSSAEALQALHQILSTPLQVSTKTMMATFHLDKIDAAQSLARQLLLLHTDATGAYDNAVQKN
jgi:hypothetical protein